MEAIKGIFDGKEILLKGKLPERAYKVIVVFEEEISIEEDEIREFTSQTKQWDFWKDEKENIYQEYLVK